MGSEFSDRLPALSRRGFLGGIVAGAAVASLPSTSWAMPVPGPRSATEFFVRRREDLARVRITPVGLIVNMQAGTITVDPQSPYQRNGNPVGRLIVDFGPQHVVEQGLAVGANTRGVRPPVSARMAGPSRVVFEVSQQVALTPAALLDWSRRPVIVPPVAAYPRVASIPDNVLGKGYSPPAAAETSIEMPWWLVISPHALSAWTSVGEAKTADGRTEVMNTRLATWNPVGPPVEGSPMSTVRGVWIRDPSASSMLMDGIPGPAINSEGYPFPMVPNPTHRAAIVRLTTRTGNNQPGGPAEPVQARLALTPLGGHLEAEGAWNSPGVSNVTAWQQRIWQGRDTYAKIVSTGFLYPWGMRAALIEEGVRTFAFDAAGVGRMFWRIQERITVTEPVVDYADSELATGPGKRGSVFRRVACTTMSTPVLAPSSADLNQAPWRGQKVFVPQVRISGGGTVPFRFEFVCTDTQGHDVTMAMPLLFAADDSAQPRRGVGPRNAQPGPNFTAEGARVLREFYAGLDVGKKAADFAGQLVGYAEDAANDLATSLITRSMVFDIAAGIDLDRPGAIPFLPDNVARLYEQLQPYNLPFLREAEVVLEDVSRLVDETITTALNYPRTYIENALDEARNVGQVYLQKATEELTEIAMSAAQAGGVIVPKMDLAGMSAKLGPIYGDAREIAAFAADGKITPGEALAAIKLLGGVSLSDILPARFAGIVNGEPSDQALRITAKVVDTGRPTERVVTTMAMDWTKDLESNALLNVDKATLKLKVDAEVPTAGGKGSWAVNGEFTDFIVTLIPVDGLAFVIVDVEKLVFTAGSGTSADVDVDVRDINFDGAMAFIQSLAAYLPFGDSLAIDISERGIRAGLTLGLPDVALGAFALTGISVDTGLTVPFGSDPVKFRFGMSAPDNPFGVSIMGLGGGGWFRNDLDLLDIEMLDVAVFAEARLQLDLGVASGGVSVKVGLQYFLAADPVKCDLTAFIRINGRVSVLGIASASVEIYVGLAVTVPPRAPNVILTGEARCSVRIKVAFFSKRVSFTVKRSVTGSSWPPGGRSADSRSLTSVAPRAAEEPVTFADAMSRANWDAYCGAFR